MQTSHTFRGKMVTQELVPGGGQLKVTRSNVHAYIHRLAYHKQNTAIADQCKALIAGFRVLIPLPWVRMFNSRELQMLISGSRRSIDIADMKRHVHYASGYHESQPYIQAFWEILESMSPDDQGTATAGGAAGGGAVAVAAAAGCLAAVTSQLMLETIIIHCSF